MTAMVVTKRSIGWSVELLKWICGRLGDDIMGWCYVAVCMVVWMYAASCIIFMPDDVFGEGVQ